MCGIFGEFINQYHLTDKSEFILLNNLSKKRGPDSSGYYTNSKNIQFAFNRLAILDLSCNANQPILSPDGKFVMVFNGEIYNHMEIRKEIPYDYYMFKGNSDTETLIVAFQYFDYYDVIQKMDGMFAIALFNLEENYLILARDFAGIKPLYYGISNNSLIFASQFNQITLHPFFKNKSIDPTVLKLYLRIHHIPAPFGLLNDTFQVKPGEIIYFDTNKKLKSKTYWTLPNYFPDYIRNEEKSLHILDEELNESVKSELMSDVPIGSFLSGGIDSSLITYYASENFPGKIKSFSIGSDSKVHDESDYILNNSELMNVDLNYKKIDGKYVLSMFDEVMDNIHEPFADYSVIPTFIVSKFARSKLTVSLSGDGGDELFFGYERFHSLLKNIGIYKFPYFIKYPVYGIDKILFKNKHFNSLSLFKFLGKAHMELHSRFNENSINSIFPDLSDVSLPDGYDVFNYENSDNIYELLESMRKAEFYEMMQKTLKKVDIASMANSLEVRVPFLKKKFIDAALKIDPLLGYDSGKRKSILKKLLSINIPSIKIQKDKFGFSIPLSKWISEDLKNEFESRLYDKNMIKYFNINQNNLKHVFDEHISNKAANKWQLFTLYSLFKWKENLLKK
ncbi:MAG: asparagine synthase (glutamine-hydrolyzing) [bacterium]